MKVSARTPKRSRTERTPKRKYAWWIEPIDDITNHAIADELTGAEIERIEVGEGNEKRAWPCDSKLVQKLKAAARTSLISLRYRVYNRCGQGQIRRVPFFEPR